MRPNPNLLPSLLSRDNLLVCAGALGFEYSINEGGFISPDRAVILIDNRCPYVGMLLPYHSIPESVGTFWVNKILGVLKGEQR